MKTFRIELNYIGTKFTKDTGISTETFRIELNYIGARIKSNS